ncbi:MAG TPA: helix-turn-helix transcriptional regulator [Chthonomonadaceae bacterium]|nr:helix-turn-helix transcriptional regulator [Chthonomonadaceae bacterium]
MSNNEEFVRSSGNVFADLGLPNAEIELAKAQMAAMIRDIIRERRLTQQQAAHVLGIDQAKVSAIMNGKVSGYTYDRLVRYLNQFGRDVTLLIGPEKAEEEGQTKVMVAYG